MYDVKGRTVHLSFISKPVFIYNVFQQLQSEFHSKMFVYILLPISELFGLTMQHIKYRHFNTIK